MLLTIMLRAKILSTIKQRSFHTITAKPGVQALSYDLVTQYSTQDKDVPPIIFMHGLLGNKKHNRSAARQLSKQLQTPIIVPDLRNHGTSFHSPEMNYEVMSDDLTNLINHLPPDIPKNKGFIIMGHSMGAKVAMIHGLRYPEIVKGVVSIDNVPYMNSAATFSTFQGGRLVVRTIMWCLEEHPEWSIKQIHEYVTKWVQPNSMVVDYFVSNLETKNGRVKEKANLRVLEDVMEKVIGWQLHEFGDLDQFAGQINAPPLLLIRAAFSDFIGQEVHQHEISRFFPRYEIQDINTSHWIVTDDPKGFVKIVNDWASKTFKQ